jgi:hypothetical protein
VNGFARPYNSPFVYLMIYFWSVQAVAARATYLLAESGTQNMLLKVRATLELLKLCPGILSRVNPRVINTDFQYAIGLRVVRDAPREQQPYVTACMILHELNECGRLGNVTLSRAGRKALGETRDYYRKLREARHQCVLDEIRERSGLRTQGSILDEIREHHATGHQGRVNLRHESG